MKRTTIAMIVVALMVCSASIAAATVYPIDDNHSLDRKSTIESYEETGVATAEIDAPRVTITVAEEADEVGLDSYHIDSANDYLQIQYHEDVPRTLRIYLPVEYIPPRTIENVKAEDSDVTADIRPIRGGTYTAVEIRFTESGTATFKLSKEAGMVFGYVDKYAERVNKTTGWEPPNPFKSNEQWEYIPPEEISGENTVFVVEKPEGEPIMIQYDNDNDPHAERWLLTEDCSKTDSAPVCTFNRAGDDNRVYVLSRETEAPGVRYKYEVSRIEQTRAGLRELMIVPQRIKDVIPFFWEDEDDVPPEAEE